MSERWELSELEARRAAVDALRRIADAAESIADAAESIAEELRVQRLERERAQHGEDVDVTDEEREALQVFTPKGEPHG